MDENGRVHPECANAANPYHECGVYCLEKIAEGKGRKEKDKKKLGNYNGLKEVVPNKRNEDGGRVQPNCPKASNAYHECNESCIPRTSKANTQGVRKESDNRNGIKQGELSIKKDDMGRVHSSCSKASNPYHECDENCFKRTTDAKIQMVKKESDIRNGIRQGELSKKKDVERTSHPTCPKASNPYHECDENCFKRNTDADTQGFRKESGSKILDASRSFGKKKKGSESQPKSSRALEITPSAGGVYPGDPKSPRSHFSRKKMEVENGESFSSSEQHSEEIYSRDQSFDKSQTQYPQSLPMSGKITSGDTPTKFKEAEKVQNYSKVSSGANTEDGRDDVNSSNFSFSGIVRALEQSADDEEEVESVISDSCVSVGKYHVKASISSILQSIFDKYGDIAANCQLESASMRAYYLECLCAVVQELHSTPFKQLTRAKVKEMFAVLKDVESAHIDVSWLRALLNEIAEAVELVSQQQTFEAKKAKYDRSLESARKELESQMEYLAQKEEEVAEARKRVAETKARVDEIENECSQLDKTISSILSITEKFQGKSLADELL
ncbi:Phospholipase-like protein [Corchorus olitorius]|uniref:Phospholipase-like protein n=1 Tax=Corchorus olitorius TaxID=93759 RepID=A0A1R3JD55_9ROSI|nr:Phospholipase-like protein [Corchorus olitorius]